MCELFVTFMGYNKISHGCKVQFMVSKYISLSLYIYIFSKNLKKVTCDYLMSKLCLFILSKMHTNICKHFIFVNTVSLQYVVGYCSMCSDKYRSICKCLLLPDILSKYPRIQCNKLGHKRVLILVMTVRKVLL